MIDFMGLYNSEHGYYKEPKLAAIWNLCYHFYVPQENLDLLQEQASKLLSFSETPQSWSESQYAAIKFVSLQTVDELRKIWLQFAEKRSDVDHANYESSRRSEIKRFIMKYMKLAVKLCLSLAALIGRRGLIQPTKFYADTGRLESWREMLLTSVN
jgi:hypothetical protein